MMGAYTTLEMEAALCVWEAMLDRKAADKPFHGDGLLAFWERRGTVETRHAAIPVAQFALKVFDALGGADAIEALDLIPYDWAFIPAVVNLVTWEAEGPSLPTIEAACDTLRQPKS
jgi:hypothetical protein